MLTAILLIILGTLTRLAHLPSNAAPIGALALYAGARLPRRWAFLVPLAAMAVSDVWLDWGTQWPFFTVDRAVSYATFALIVLAGSFVKEAKSPWTRPLMAVGGSTLFFLTTNFGSWAFPHDPAQGFINYPRSLDGLFQSYVLGLPFYQNQIVGDLVGTAVLFGLDSLARRVGDMIRRPAKIEAVPATVE